MGDSATSSAQQEMLVKLSTDGVPKLFCPICNKALVSLAGYVKHLKKHEPPGGFCCRYCEARFCSDEDLKKHRETQHTTIACRLCKNTTFTNEDDYRIHIRDVHKGVDRQLYNCEKCGAAYKTLEPYRRHIETQCGTIKPYQCNQCPMAFVTKYNLKQHLENHSGELKFCCSYCGRNFKQKARLVEHERTHTGEKPYKCDVCGKSFSHRESIVTHSSIHTGIRLVECKCCGSRFSCHSNLIKHRRNRPETCGLPEYDPPKNRVRKHTSRIPAILNPTSEIKVVNVNKIIKPGDMEKVNALKKDSPDKDKKIKPTARKRTGGGGNATTRKRGPKKKTFKKVVIEFEDSVDEDDDDGHTWDEGNFVEVVDENNEDEDEDADNDLLEIESTKMGDSFTDVARQRRQSSKPQSADVITSNQSLTTISILPDTSPRDWSDGSEDEYIPEYEPEEEESDDGVGESVTFKYDDDMSTDGIKQEDDDAMDVTTGLQIEALNDLEFTSLHASSVSVKSEDDQDNIFNEKDKILECLLNEGDYKPMNDGGNATTAASHNHRKRKRSVRTSQQQKAEDEDVSYLEETEVVLVKNEDDEQDFTIEDMLDVREESVDSSNRTECFVLVEDITHRFPQLKTQSTIKVARNVQPFYSNNGAIKNLMRKPAAARKSKTKEKLKTSTKSETSSRRPRITAGELKERMKLLKKRDTIYNCVECIKMYYMRKPYEKHLRDDHKKSEQEIRDIFKDEEVDLAADNVYKCHICDKIYLMEKRLIDHIPKHGAYGKLIYKCPCYCALYFATREDAQLHAQEAHREQLWCEICQKFMTGCDALKSHRMRLHGNKEDLKFRRNLVCDKCGKKFMGRTQLTDHVRSDCGRLPIYQCQECGKCLTTAGILKTHMLLHQDERPFQCEQCGKAFKIKAQYKTHTRFAHSDEKRFKCHLCPKAYPYRESLLTHMSVHTGIKRFLCNGCGKRFTCVSNLQAHRKVHAETCGLLPLNAKATQYMGVQKGTLLMGAKPEPGLDYVESQTVVAKEVYTQDASILQDVSTRVIQPSDTLSGGLPLNYTTNDLMLL